MQAAPTRLGWAALLAAGVAVACFPYRLDYAAHLLGGLGLAGLGWAGTGEGGVVGPWDPARRVWVVGVVVVVAAVVSEYTVSGPPDLLDVANTVMGALVGLAALVGATLDEARAQSTPPPGAVSEPHGAADGQRSGDSGGLISGISTGWNQAVVLAGVGTALVVGGLFVRHVVQNFVKVQWWFGW